MEIQVFLIRFLTLSLFGDHIVSVQNSDTNSEIIEIQRNELVTSVKYCLPDERYSSIIVFAGPEYHKLDVKLIISENEQREFVACVYRRGASDAKGSVQISAIETSHWVSSRAGSGSTKVLKLDVGLPDCVTIQDNDVLKYSASGLVVAMPNRIGPEEISPLFDLCFVDSLDNLAIVVHSNSIS